VPAPKQVSDQDPKNAPEQVSGLKPKMTQALAPSLLAEQQKKQLIWALCTASVIIYLNLYVMQGMLPSIAEHFKVTGAKAALVLSVTSFTLAFSLLLFALISDRVGRRGPIIITLWLLAASNILLIFVQDFHALTGVRLLQGILLAGVPAIAMAYMKEQLDPIFMLKAAAIYITANSFGGIIGRIIGGLLSQHLDWQQGMSVLFALTFFGVALVHYLLPKLDCLLPKHTPLLSKEDNLEQSLISKKTSRVSQRSKLQQDLAGFRFHLADKPMRLAFLVGGLAFFIMVNQFSFIQLHLMAQPYNFSRFEATLIFLCYSSGTLASYLSARWIAKFGSLPLFKIALALMLFGSCLTLLDSLSSIIVGFLITASGFFLTHSCCNAFVALRAQSHRAKATALYLCCYYLGAALGGPYMMAFWQQGHWNGVVLGSVLILVLLAITIGRLQWQMKKIKEEELQASD
jgi:YNFM family putative membrane transporter